MNDFLDIDTNKTDKWETHLLIDAMYYHAARQAHKRAINTLKNIKKADHEWEKLEAKESEILSRYKGNHIEAYDELEPVCIQMENAHYNIGEARAPLLKEVATVHLLSIASLEAHINSVAATKLKGKELSHFEKISIEAKWLFFPKILGLTGFQPGRQPFQRFSKLIKYRNALVHFKGIKEPWVQGAAPQFINDLGLSLPSSEDSLKAVSEMITELSKQLEMEVPYWLRDDINDMSYFGFEINW